MHLSDEQLNEYLDDETDDFAGIELHVSNCADCAARLNALQTLFEELESLPDLALSTDFVVPVTPAQRLSPQLPRFLTLTLALQAALALVVIIIAAPLLMPLLSQSVLDSSARSLTEIFLFLQHEWAAWLDRLSTLQLPALPQIPMFEISRLFIALVVIGVSLLWLIGNGLLLRNQIK